VRINKSLITFTPTSGSGSGTVTSVALSAPTGFVVTGSPITSSGTLAITFASGYSLPTTTKQGEWDTSYNRSLTAIGVTGTTTKTLTLTKQDGTTLTASWTDINTDAVTSVFGRTGAVIAVSGDYTTTLVTEGTNLYYTEARVNANANVAANTAARHNAVTLGTANGLSLSTQVLSLGLSSNSTTGALSSTDWLTFSSKQPAITLTTTGNSGSSTLIGATLNVPTYTLVGLGGMSNPFTTGIGQLIYSNGAGAPLSLAPNTTTTKKYLSMTGDGTNGDAPFWDTIPASVGGSGTTNYIAKFTSTNAIGVSLIYDNGTNVGIGTPTPQAKLDVVGSGTISGVASLGISEITNLAYIGDRNTTNTRYIKFNRASSLTDIVNIQGVNGGIGAANISLQSEGANVGIGTATPLEKLDVQGIILGGNGSATDGTIVLQDQYGLGHLLNIGTNRSSGGVVLGYGVYPSGVSTNAFISSTSIALERGALSFDGSFRWYTGSSQTVSIGTAATLTAKMLLDNNGNLGVGNLAPQSRLQVSGGGLAISGTGFMVSAGLTNGRLETYDAGSLQAIHSYLDSQTYEISAGSTSGYVSGLVVTGRGATLLPDRVAIYTRSVQRFQIGSLGQLQLNAYTSATSFTGTPTAYLACDSSGNIITSNPSSGRSTRLAFSAEVPNTWSNMPNTLQFFDSSSAYVTQIDLTAYNQVRLIVNKQGTAGATGSKLLVRYQATTGAPFTESSYLAIGTSEVSLAVDTTNNILVTSWIDLASGAKSDVWVALMGIDGDTTADPVFGNIYAEFRFN